MTLFAAAAAIGAAVQDIVFGEPIAFLPWAKGKYVAGSADPDRPARDLVGIFDEELVTVRPVGSGANTHDTVDLTGSAAQVEFNLALFPTETDRPRQGDHLQLTGRAGQPSYSVKSVRPDDTGRLVCIVGPTGPAP